MDNAHIAPDPFTGLESRLGLGGLPDFIETEIIPELEVLPAGPPRDKKKFPKVLAYPLLLTGFFTAPLVSFGNGLLPDTALGNFLQFILSVMICLGVMAFCLFVFRNRIAELFREGQVRFIHRTAAMTKLSEALGLTYIPLPGGASAQLKSFAKWKYCPALVQEMVASMDDYGGFDDVAGIVTRSGLAMPAGLLIGSDKNRERVLDAYVKAQQFEDGFKGERRGVKFSALEWEEKLSESTLHHMLIVLELPTRLTGLVEFKSKSASWPIRSRSHEWDKVKLVSKDFHKTYKVRANDQMEARLVFNPAVIERVTDFAKGDAVRGVAFDSHLVFDIAGENRFQMVDLLTGEWSRESIRQTLTDLADMLDLVDGVAQAFRVKAGKT